MHPFLNRDPLVAVVIERHKIENSRRLPTHFTCATDSPSIRHLNRTCLFRKVGGQHAATAPRIDYSYFFEAEQSMWAKVGYVL